MNVHWLEQISASVPAGDSWLSPREACHLYAMRFPKRRADWRLGRWTAKNAVAIFLDIPLEPELLREIEIRPAASGAPEVCIGNDLALIQVSLSHRNGVGTCLLTQSSALLGCDLEIVEPHSAAFVADYFTSDEQDFVAEVPEADRPCLLALLWSAKESALKALREGLRLDPRQMIVSIYGLRENQTAYQNDSQSGIFPFGPTSPPEIDWNPLKVRTSNGQPFLGWWSRTGELVRTMLALPSPDERPEFLWTKKTGADHLFMRVS